ncbi:MAG: hypothetical protein FJX35_01385 [Alphaproteobacteria bacterium]|nr:hypothetical protein [Alphaproteobacteria bacterium]
MELEARAPAEGCRVADQVTLGSTASNTISAAFTGRVPIQRGSSAYFWSNADGTQTRAIDTDIHGDKLPSANNLYLRGYLPVIDRVVFETHQYDEMVPPGVIPAVVALASLPPRRQNSRIYLYQPPDQFEPLEMPPANGEITLTRVGVVGFHFSAQSRWALPDGLYLSQGKSLRLLLPGLGRGLAVSPDGCSVAFAHAPVHDPPGATSLKVIDLCKLVGVTPGQ